MQAIPGINANWLLTGEGEMLNGAPPTQTVRQTNSGGDNINATLSTVATGDTPDTVNALLEMLKTAQQQVATAQQQVTTLADATSRQADQLAELTRIVAELTRRLP